MLFKDWKSYDKKSVLKTWQYKILEKTLKLLAEDDIKVYRNSLKRYIRYLLEDTDYDPYTNVFYEPVSKFKFSVDVFSSIAYEYVLEHLEDFKVKAGKDGKV